MSDTPHIEQEVDRLRGARLLLLAALTLVVAMLGVAGAWLLFRTGHERRAARRNPPHAALPPEAPEQTPILGPARGLLMQAQQRQKLGGYGWVNRDRGLAHIPIERAIDLRADRAR
jgi:hypothetical protein